jgi:Arc/MetJ family transcription regulator
MQRHNHPENMRTSIDIDDQLMRDALAATGLRTRKQAVEAGLLLLIRLKAQEEIEALAGKVAWQANLPESPT